MRIAGQNLPTEDIKCSGVHEKYIFLLESFIALFEQDRCLTRELNNFLDFWKVCFDSITNRSIAPDLMLLCAANIFIVVYDAVNPLFVYVIFIVGKFVLNINCDQ